MRLTPQKLIRTSVLVMVACVSWWCGRMYPQRHLEDMRRPILVPMASAASEKCAVNLDMLQTIATVMRLAAPGRVEDVELDTRHVGQPAILVISMIADNGDIRKDYIVLDGLIIQPMQDGIVRLQKPSPSDGVTY